MTGVIHFFTPTTLFDADGFKTSATVYLYYSGTTNLAPIYLDSALTIPKANPFDIALGASLPPFYLDPNITYRRRMIFGTGAVEDADPVVTGSDGAIVTYYDVLQQVQDLEVSTKAAALTAQMYYPGARTYIPRGLTSVTITAPGTGGTNGVYICPLTGDNLSVDAYASVTVSGGVVTSVSVSATGLYLGASPVGGTVDVSSITGLTGATLTAVIGYLKTSGQYYLTDHASDTNQVALFQNQANSPVEIDASVDWLNINQSEAWAEGTEPGGVGTKSSKEWAEDAADSASVVGSQFATLLLGGSNFLADVESGIPPLEISMDGYVISERLPLTTNPSIYPQVIEIHTGDGQSNGEGQAAGESSVVYPTLGFKNRPSMPETTFNDVWLGLRTSGGASVELSSGAVTGITGLVDSAPTSDYGTCECSAAAITYTQKAFDVDSFVPNVIVWNNSEGGELISNMLNTAGTGEYYFDNYVTAITSLAAYLPSAAAHTWSYMNQGESNSSSTSLGSDHNLLRSQMQEVAENILGQTIPLRMISVQPSSFYNNSDGAQSILQEALNDTEGLFFCGGPTYHYPWTTADYLHHTSMGHAMSGYNRAWVIDEFLRTGSALPLHMVSATVLDASTIRVTLSQPSVIDTAWLVDASGLVNSGISVTGATISGVSVVGTTLDITTSTSAYLATSVGAALAGHGTAPRTATKIPRSTIRSIEQWGTFPDGSACHKALCHQSIDIT